MLGYHPGQEGWFHLWWIINGYVQANTWYFHQASKIVRWTHVSDYYWMRRRNKIALVWDSSIEAKIINGSRISLRYTKQSKIRRTHHLTKPKDSDLSQTREETQVKEIINS